ncbi:hypothetical protein [Flavivirga rizhaonensis]|uniref:hypothetical protein n=1 Tax=Flavivirga rizhaonensis TaxID=2559571 RepID=UPI0014768D52|nr:hypothetical protein [Flavivirga rizhaonensis]
MEVYGQMLTTSIGTNTSGQFSTVSFEVTHANYIGGVYFQVIFRKSDNSFITDGNTI